MTFQDVMDKAHAAFPGCYVDIDYDGQIVVYTNLEFLTSEDNPSIPLGEHIVQEMEQL